MTPMVVQCLSCLTEFELDPDKVPADGVRARCSVCSAVIVVPSPRSAPSSSPPLPPATPAPATWRTAPAAAQAEVPIETPAEAAVEQPVGPPAAPTPPAPPPVERHTVESTPFAPPRVESYQPAPSSASTPVAPLPEPAARPAWSASDRPEFAQVVPPPMPPAVPASAPTSGASVASTPEPEGPRRSINPFLTRDPALRAKRLARALVSDIVAYHPARHAEGLRDGTLKTLFRDEIKKSYEEYVDQVGRDFAGSTTHFQDALNDVLASGKKLF